MEKINYQKVRGNPVYRTSSRLLDLGLSSLGLTLFSPPLFIFGSKNKIRRRRANFLLADPAGPRGADF